MKKYFLSFFLIIAFAFYVILENQNSISVVSNSPDNSQSGNNAGSITNTPASLAPLSPSSSNSAGAPSPTIPPTPTTAGLYRDGSYSGDSVNAYFGNVQVKAVISGGKLANVQILDYSKDRATSAHINNAALPKLVQEAISSQSAKVDIVSGATQTSQGFQASLTSALAKAKS
jgi:uncharacterized protein with FMN-binding domain